MAKERLRKMTVSFKMQIIEAKNDTIKFVFFVGEKGMKKEHRTLGEMKMTVNEASAFIVRVVSFVYYEGKPSKSMAATLDKLPVVVFDSANIEVAEPINLLQFK